MDRYVSVTIWDDSGVDAETIVGLGPIEDGVRALGFTPGNRVVAYMPILQADGMYAGMVRIDIPVVGEPTGDVAIETGRAL